MPFSQQVSKYCGFNEPVSGWLRFVGTLGRPCFIKATGSLVRLVSVASTVSVADPVCSAYGDFSGQLVCCVGVRMRVDHMSLELSRKGSLRYVCSSTVIAETRTMVSCPSSRIPRSSDIDPNVK